MIPEGRRQWPTTRALVVLISTYRRVLSPWLGGACRFYPTCSAYALDAIQNHGGLPGTYLTLRRLARCHPWCEGGIDPVPPEPPRLFTYRTSRTR